MKFGIELSDYKLFWDIRDNAVGRQWSQALINNFLGPESYVPKTHPLNKTDLYFMSGGCTKDELLWRINNGIKILNEDLDGYGKIEYFTEDNCTNQDFFNRSHKHFENLIGQKWNVSPWFSEGTERVKWAIRELNSTIHGFERMQNNTLLWGISYDIRDHINNKQPQYNQIEELEANKITLDSYKCYQKGWEWGNLGIAYCQTGKLHYDAFIDQDEHIEKDNISGHRYITGECCCPFTDTFKYDRVKQHQYDQWLINNGFDLNDITQCYDGLIVGDFDWSASKHRKKELENKLNQDCNILKLGLYNYNYTPVMVNDYSWYTWKDHYEAERMYYGRR
tara:strand:- start:267 stop:1274 length:1008 start_codon:yes stop_codon:yes gene_type:complete